MLEARESGVPLKRQAVLFRSSHHSDVLELELARRNIPVREVRRAEVSRSRAREGSAGGAALGRQPEEPHRRVPRAAAAAREWGRRRRSSCSRVRGSGIRWPALSDSARPRARRRMGAVRDADDRSRGVAEGPWQGQVGRVREWFEPHLERIYDAAQVRAGDLVQLERIAQQFATREQFLAELALDPPQATGDLSGAPHLDED